MAAKGAGNYFNFMNICPGGSQKRRDQDRGNGPISHCDLESVPLFLQYRSSAHGYITRVEIISE